MATVKKESSATSAAKQGVVKERRSAGGVPAGRAGKAVVPAAAGKGGVARSWVSASGVVFTEADAAAMAVAFEGEDDGLAGASVRRVGRPSLSDRVSGPSPRVSVRLGGEAFAALKARADAENRRVSDVAREAIEAYVAR